MFLRQKIRKKDGKEHRYFSVVENQRVAGGRVVQRQVLYLGEINDTQQLAWRRSTEVFKAKWGEQLVGDGAIGLALFLLAIPVFGISAISFAAGTSVGIVVLEALARARRQAATPPIVDLQLRP